MIGPVFAFPAAPHGWEKARAQLVRIIDPLGGGIAWFSPDHGACCAGYAVRANGEWTQVIASPVPEAHERTAPSNACVPLIDIPGATLTQPWELAERDPTSVMLENCFGGSALQAAQLEISHRVRIRLMAGLGEHGLSLSLEALNHGPDSIDIGIGIRVTVPAELVDPVAVRSAISRGSFRDGTTVSLSDAQALTRIRIRAETGVCELEPGDPADQSTVALSILGSKYPVSLPVDSTRSVAVSIEAADRVLA